MNPRYWYAGGLCFSIAAAIIFMMLLIPSSSSNRKKKAPPPSSTVAKVTAVSTPLPNLDLISANNLFHPYRGKPVPTEENAKAKTKGKPPARFKFVLTGVFRSGEEYGALLVIMGNRTNPARKDELEKADANIFIQSQEIAEGYILQEVQPDRVIIIHNDEKIEVLMEKLATPNEPSEKSDDKKSSKSDAASTSTPAGR